MAGPTSVKGRLGRVVKIVVMNTKRETSCRRLHDDLHNR